MAEYPPYVNAYGKIKVLFKKVSEASVPPKFSQDFLSTALGLSSSSDRALIPLLKRLGFLDAGNVPTQDYKDYRDPTLSKAVMANRIRESYREIFQANEYAYRVDKKELTALVKRVTGVKEGDPIITVVVGTFMALRELADFEAELPKRPAAKAEEVGKEVLLAKVSKLGLSYTIILNLPATSDIEVFNAIFKSLKENLLIE